MTQKLWIKNMGSCSYFKSCKVDQLYYFGPYCKGLGIGATCIVEATEYLSIMGYCESSGHCADGMGNTALHHEACKHVKNKVVTEEENELEDASSILAKCQTQYLREQYYQLKKICEDCYNLYKNHEIYILCMSQCFLRQKSLFLISCTKRLMMERNMVDKMVHKVEEKMIDKQTRLSAK